MSRRAVRGTGDRAGGGVLGPPHPTPPRPVSTARRTPAIGSATRAQGYGSENRGAFRGYCDRFG